MFFLGVLLSDVKSSLLCNIIDHVFLPRRLQGGQGDLHQTESYILQQFNDVVQKRGTPTLKQLFAKLKQLYCDDECNPKLISQQLENLQPGDMLGIYVRAQNCGLFIHMPKDGPKDEVTICTFSASLPNEIIYGDSINGDIQVIFIQFTSNYY